MAAKFTNTHHRIFHKSTKGQGTTVLPPNSQTTNVNGGGQGKNFPRPTQTTAANGGKPTDGEVSSEGRASGGGDGEGGDRGGNNWVRVNKALTGKLEKRLPASRPGEEKKDEGARAAEDSVQGDNSGGATEEVDDDQRVASISE